MYLFFFCHRYGNSLTNQNRSFNLVFLIQFRCTGAHIGKKTRSSCPAQALLLFLPCSCSCPAPALLLLLPNPVKWPSSSSAPIFGKSRLLWYRSLHWCVSLPRISNPESQVTRKGSASFDGNDRHSAKIVDATVKATN